MPMYMYTVCFFFYTDFVLANMMNGQPQKQKHKLLLMRTIRNWAQ